MSTFKYPLSIFKRSNNDNDAFWALRDVSFKVEEGKVVGIIGRNGAGKSTLLKILSLIAEPTDGRVTLKGRVASLLEVGTGFHPELTGRENIYLSGSILGMRKSEIDAKFDEIVEFAEIEKFLDTPVKSIQAECMGGLLSLLRRILSLRFCWRRRCWLWGMRGFKRSVWGRWLDERLGR